MSLFGATDITGIDIGAGSIKVVRIADGKNPRLLSADIVELPLEPGPSDSLSVNLRHLLLAHKISGKNIVTLMPAKDLTIRSLSLPVMPLAELAEAVRWEAKRHVSYPLDSALVEYLILGEKKEGAVSKYDILLVAAERNTVVEHLAPLREAGIEVTAVDANPLALRNILWLRKKADSANTLVVDIGAGKTEINIFKGGALRFSRCLESGGLDMTRAISDQLGLTLQDAEAVKLKINALDEPGEDNAAVLVRGRIDTLLMEIRRSVEYYKTTFREKGVEGTVLTGGVALMPGIGEYFSHELAGPVEIDQPFSGIACSQDLLDEFGPVAPRFSAAVGLALRKG